MVYDEKRANAESAGGARPRLSLNSHALGRGRPYKGWLGPVHGSASQMDRYERASSPRSCQIRFRVAKCLQSIAQLKWVLGRSARPQAPRREGALTRRIGLTILRFAIFRVSS